jgi:integrase
MNTLAVMFKILRSFIIWCIKNDFTVNDPFKNYKSPSEKYGTPYYLSIAERNDLYHFDLSERPELETQRDIFVFQCVVGCRVGDLLLFTKANVINDTIEYYAEKTKGKDPNRISVPLNTIAKEILKKYADCAGEKLLPFISEQKYNDAIKEAFRVAEINRRVMILNPLTRESEIRPLNEIASSHLARRTFCGNLYKKVKDPNLVGALSGHKEGSKAFARYRDIDEEMKKDLVSMLE